MRRILLLTAIVAASHAQYVHAQVAAMSTWTNTGPISFPVNQSGQIHGIGRVSQIKFHPTNPAKVYAVSASGGLFKSIDTGLNWAPTAGTEKLPQTSSSALCIDFTNDQNMYLCLGDANYYTANYGIYKSTNGGTSWTTANSSIGTAIAVEILMHPTNNQVLVAATNTGIWKTTTGGTKWTRTQTATGFRDMKVKPGTGSLTLYACTTTAVYYSTNFGDTWTLATGITAPSSNDGMRLAVSAQSPTTVYAAATKSNGVVWKSTNSGASFTQVYSSTSQCLTCYTASPTSGSQGDYNFDITANPTNGNELLMVAHCVWRSIDGGVTWSKRTSWQTEMHTDMHHIEWNPYNNSQRWCANDGGVWMSTDTDATIWNPRSQGLAATEIYHAAQSPVVRELVSIGTQDNGEMYYNNGTWYCDRGGDWNSRCQFDYGTSGTVYYQQNGYKRNLLPIVGEISYNSPFTSTNDAQIEFVKTVPGTAFTGVNSIYRSTNINTTAPTWTLIKSSTEPVKAIVSSSADSNILFIVTGSGHIFRSKDALSATPTFKTITTPKTTATTASLATVKINKKVVFLTCGPYIYRSVDTGNTWVAVSLTGLPSGVNIRRIIHDDYSTKQRLFVNAGNYVHYKDSTTTTWTNHSSTMGLPTVCNGTDFMIYNDGTGSSLLRYATYGRGVWQCKINANLAARVMSSHAASAPVANFSIKSNRVCVGSSVLFTDSSVDATRLEWKFPGGIPSSSTAKSVWVTYPTKGSYNVTLTATNDSGSSTADYEDYIIVSPAPTVAISSDGTILHATGARGTYQWLFNQMPIEGAVAASYQPASSGSYSVAVKSTAGCVVTSNSYTYEATPFSFNVYPNPSTGLVNVKISAPGAKEATIQCFSTLGILLRKEVIRLNGEIANYAFDLSALSKGQYEIKVSINSNQFLSKSIVLQ